MTTAKPETPASADDYGMMCAARDQYFRDLQTAGIEWTLAQSAGFHRGFLDALVALRALPASPRAEEAARSGVEGWQPIATAPKDGTLVLLLIAPTDQREHPLEDTAEGSRTIGHNNLSNDGDDVWLFSGWTWEQDCYVEGKGTPIAWQPLPAAPEAMRVKEGK